MTADEADPAIDDDQLAVVAIIHAAEIAQAERMEMGHLRAGRREHLLDLAFELPAAGAVDEHSDFDALSRFLREQFRQLTGDRALVPDIAFDVNALLRRCDVAHHERKESITVLQDLDAIAFVEAGLRETRQ